MVRDKLRYNIFMLPILNNTRQLSLHKSISFSKNKIQRSINVLLQYLNELSCFQIYFLLNAVAEVCLSLLLFLIFIFYETHKFRDGIYFQRIPNAKTQKKVFD